MQIYADIDFSWQPIVQEALLTLDPRYRHFLEHDTSYFPNRENFLNAFKTLPLEKTKYILFGQDPYPREESAIGYAFIDGAVGNLFGDDGGLSKAVNRATSLRNFAKMVFVCEEKLKDDLSKDAVAKIDKISCIKTIHQLRENFEKNGILLLNTALIFTAKEDSKKHIKAWKPFVESLLAQLKAYDIELILFGNAAKEIGKFTSSEGYVKHLMPHPYNISFIRDENAHRLFKPMRLFSL